MIGHRHDVIIVGAGMAGLLLARQLLLETDKTVLLLERKSDVPGARNKVGESISPVAGHYLAEQLELGDYLRTNEQSKATLRFYWKSPDAPNDQLDHYRQSQSFLLHAGGEIYQIDRLRMETELLRLNTRNNRFSFRTGIRKLEFQLAAHADTPHQVGYSHEDEKHTANADWLVDASGRGRHLAHHLNLHRASEIRHSAFFWWVDGLIDVSQLPDHAHRKFKLEDNGDLPAWLATNHFCIEGAWFWVIPLVDRTSLGIVYDNRKIGHDQIDSVQKAVSWTVRTFPLFARDLPNRKVLHHARFPDYSHDCLQCISRDRWGITGDAARFSDPLYSLGMDLIALHNNFITETILTGDPRELEIKTNLYDQCMNELFAMHQPSFHTSYDALGDQESYTFKYVFDIVLYFSAINFPHLNDLFVEKEFLYHYLRFTREISKLGRNFHQFLNDYYHWKKDAGIQSSYPARLDLATINPVRAAMQICHHRNVTIPDAREILEQQRTTLEEWARFLHASATSAITGDRSVLTNKSFINDIDPVRLSFDPSAMSAASGRHAHSNDQYAWSFDHQLMTAFESTQSAETRTASKP